MYVYIVNYNLLNIIALPSSVFVAGALMISLVTFRTFPFDLEAIKEICDV